MALVPAYKMAGELPSDRQALPVLKVLYRNSSRIQEQQFAQRDTLHHVDAAESVEPDRRAEWLRDAIRADDLHDAEARFAAIAASRQSTPSTQLQFAVEDDVNVHRVVLAWRAWAMLELTGQQYAQTLLRQSVRFCIDSEQSMRDHQQPAPEVRAVLPRLVGRAPSVEQIARQSPGRGLSGGRARAGDFLGHARAGCRCGRRRIGRGHGSRVRGRSDLPGRQLADAARSGPAREEQYAAETAGLRPWRFGRRARFGRGQRLAQHFARQ